MMLDFRKLLRQFEPISLLTAVSAVSVYPPNGRFLGRFRFLISEIAATTSFEGQSQATIKDVANILDFIPANILSTLETIEDYEPSTVFDDVSICLHSQQYRFFYADLERPLPTAETLIDQANITAPFIRRKSQFDISATVEFLFAYQHHLVSALVNYFSKHETSPEPNNEVQLPSEEFLAYWREVQCSSFKEFRPFIRDTTSWRRWRLKTAVKIGSHSTNFTSPFIHSPFLLKMSSNLIIPLPQLGIKALQYQIRDEVARLPRGMKEEIVKALLEHATGECSTWIALLFGIQNTFPDATVIAGKNGEKPILFPFIAQADQTTLVIYTIAFGLGSQAELDASVEHSIQDYLMLEKIIRDNISITLSSDRWGQPIERNYDSDSLELIHVLLIYELGFSENGIGFAEMPSSVLIPMRGSSHKSLAQDCRDKLEFINFARAWRELSEQANIGMMFDILDAFEVFRGNGLKFVIDDNGPLTVSFYPHGWSEAEHERLIEQHHWRRIKCHLGLNDYVVHKKEEDCIGFYDPFNHFVNDVIFPADKSTHIVFHLSRFNPLHTQSDIAHSPFDINYSLVEGLKFRVRGFRKEFWDFCKMELGLSNFFALDIHLIDVGLVEGDTRFASVFDEIVAHPSRIFFTNILIKTDGTLAVMAFIAYRSQRVADGLQALDNRLEREFLHCLLCVIADSMGRLSLKNNQISRFVEKHLPIGMKSISAYAIRTMSIPPRTNEPRLPSYEDFTWVKAEIAQYLHVSAVEPKEYKNTDAISLITEIVLPFIRKKIDTFLTQFGSGTLLLRAYELLEDTESYRYYFKNRIASHVQNALTDYDPPEILADRNHELTVQVLAFTHLVELIAQCESESNLIISDSDWFRLVAMVVHYQRLVNIDETIRAGLKSTASIIIDEDYKLHPNYGTEQDGIEFGKSALAYEKANLPHYYHDPDRQSDEELPDSLVEDILQPVNHAFEEAFGVNIDDFVVTMFSLSLLDDVPAHNHTLRIATKSELVNALVRSILNITNEKVENALQLLIIDREQLIEDEINPRKLRERDNRLTTSPLLPINIDGEQKLVFGPYFVHRTTGLWLNSIQDGMLPVHSTPDNLDKAFQQYLNQRNREYEREIQTKLANNGYLALAVTDGQLRQIINEHNLSVERFPGDIDILVVLPDTQIIFVLDAKRLFKASSPRQIARERKKFSKNAKYTQKLTDKVKFVETFQREVFEYCNIPNISDTEYAVIGGFVTDRVIPSAFAVDASFPIIFDEDLQKWILSNASA